MIARMQVDQPGAGFITGQRIVVDGGRALG
jgi:hypothetical protein